MSRSTLRCAGGPTGHPRRPESPQSSQPAEANPSPKAMPRRSAAASPQAKHPPARTAIHRSRRRQIARGARRIRAFLRQVRWDHPWPEAPLTATYDNSARTATQIEWAVPPINFRRGLRLCSSGSAVIRSTVERGGVGAAMNDDRIVGVFDSGIGGLTVVRELRRRLPNENIVYFGDTARVPYGIKSPK